MGAGYNGNLGQILSGAKSELRWRSLISHLRSSQPYVPPTLAIPQPPVHAEASWLHPGAP